MKLVINRYDTGVALPPQQFTIELKELINTHEEKKLSIETLLENYEKLQQRTKINVPIFKMEKWNAWIDQQSRSLNIRFGEKGQPQLVIQEVES